jgi:hypothetical protein
MQDILGTSLCHGFLGSELQRCGSCGVPVAGLGGNSNDPSDSVATDRFCRDDARQMLRDYLRHFVGFPFLECRFLSARALIKLWAGSGNAVGTVFCICFPMEAELVDPELARLTCILVVHGSPFAETVMVLSMYFCIFLLSFYTNFLIVPHNRPERFLPQLFQFTLYNHCHIPFIAEKICSWYSSLVICEPTNLPSTGEDLVLCFTCVESLQFNIWLSRLKMYHTVVKYFRVLLT